jgi:hypothetical protein
VSPFIVMSCATPLPHRWRRQREVLHRGLSFWGTGIADSPGFPLALAAALTGKPPAREMPQQRCLQTSCWLVQLSAQAPAALVLDGVVGVAAAAAVVGIQEFWQVIASVSQLI